MFLYILWCVWVCLWWLCIASRLICFVYKRGNLKNVFLLNRKRSLITCVRRRSRRPRPKLFTLCLIRLPFLCLLSIHFKVFYLNLKFFCHVNRNRKKRLSEVKFEFVSIPSQSQASSFFCLLYFVLCLLCLWPRVPSISNKL